jgi:preprotein translocase subunit SecE
VNFSIQDLTAVVIAVALVLIFLFGIDVTSN